MSEQRRVGIIGAGVAGLACARQLADAGWSPVLFDKGRGVGGRMATRRAESNAQFDHGAQYFTARTRAFRGAIHGMTEAGAIARWDNGDSNPRFVGTPGMSAFAKHLAKGLDVRQGIKVTELQRLNNKWVVITDSVSHLFDRIVVTVPVPQAVALLGAYESLVSEIEDVRFEPCLTLMARFGTDVPQQFTCRSDPDDALAWVAHDSTKPGRPGENCWVAQASPTWSAEHLELDFRQKVNLARLMHETRAVTRNIDA